MTQPVYPIYRVPEVPYPDMVIRSRREASTRDTVNARNFEHWQTDGRYLAQDRPDLASQRPFQDFSPINSRMSDRSYRVQPRFDTDGHKMGQNTYFDKYDTAYDNRNAVRELQAVVYEDKNNEGIRESSKLLKRNFDSRWITPTEMEKITQTRLVLRPSMDDIRKVYWK
jgi:hypothetical protein